MKPKVTLIVIAPIQSNLKTSKRAYESAFNQDYENYDVMIHYEKPTDYKEGFKNKYVNCSENREIARKLALSGNAEFFLFKDWDIVFPKNVISEFIKQTGQRVTSIPYKDPETGKTVLAGQPVPEIHIQGGWYPIFGSETGEFLFYPCGKYVKDYVLVRLKEWDHSLVPVDYVGCGCLFISRKALSELYFEDGLDRCDHDIYGICVHLGECGAFGALAFEKGYRMYMNGSVVCKHIISWRLKCSSYLISLISKLPIILRPMGIRIWSRIMSVDLSPIQKPEHSSH